MVRINTEGKPMWSVTQVLDEYLGLDDEEYLGRYVLLERGERKCNISEVEVITIGASKHL